jgi:DNA invertase Pin-like site-specific DNA recombinase
LVQRAKELGWSDKCVRVIDSDLGTTASGSVDRLGFQQLLSAVCEGKVGAVFSIEASRLARNGREWHTLLEICCIMRTVLVDQDAIYDLNREWHTLLEICCIMRTVLVDQDAIYDLNLSNDRLLLGLKGEMSTMELSLLRERSQAAIQQKAKRGELYLTIPAAYIMSERKALFF